MKIRPVASELFLAVGRTDITKLIISSSKFEKAPKNASYEVQISVHTFETVGVGLSNSTAKKDALW
jgi:hypothetical protein